MHFAEVRERELYREKERPLLEDVRRLEVVWCISQFDRASATHDKIHGLDLITRKPAGKLGHCGGA
jgi:hypothetical protein